MKCCAFGTIRLDVFLDIELGTLSDISEVKIDKLKFELGGSVCNTVNVLTNNHYDVFLYSLNIIDSLSEYLKQELKKNSIKIKFNVGDLNNSALSLIFLKSDGDKQMISYDGCRNDEYILAQLVSESDSYNIFYTSLYEINENNINSIIEVYSSFKNERKWGILDLCPLIMNKDKKHLKKLLNSVNILSGTDNELQLLQNQLNIISIKELQHKFDIKYIFEKRGKRGGAAYFNEKEIESTLRGTGFSYNTTGCGDAFNAGIIIGLIEGKNIDEILRQAIDISEYVAYNGLSYK